MAGELDLMARLAGLRLGERWGGWTGERFTAASRTQVSARTAKKPPAPVTQSRVLRR